MLLHTLVGVEGVHFDEGTSDLISFKSLRLSQYVVNDLCSIDYVLLSSLHNNLFLFYFILLPW